MADELLEKIQMLERSLLELGTEIFYLRSQVKDMSQFHSSYIKTMQNLRNLMDEKGVIDRIDFEASVDFDELAKNAKEPLEMDDPFQEDKNKKYSH